MNNRQKVTIHDVAKAANVSITTVSRYLNQNYGSMSDETKERIKSVVESLNYHPNQFAQGLKRNRSQVIAAVVVNMGYPFCVSVIRSLSDALNQAGYRLLVSETQGDKARERNILHSLTAQPVDGIVIQTNGENNDVLADMAKEMPVVLVDRQFDVSGAVNIITNNADASFSMTNHLFEQGYQRVLFVTEEVQQIHTRVDRLRGYESACFKHHRSPWVVWVDRSEPSSLQSVTEELLAHAQASSKSSTIAPGFPVAVYAANGLIMLDLYPHLRALPFQTPSELGIATFDEPDWARIATPALSCVRQPTEEFGTSAAEVLLKALRRKTESKRKPPARIVLSSVLVPGESTQRI